MFCIYSRSFIIPIVYYIIQYT